MPNKKLGASEHMKRHQAFLTFRTEVVKLQDYKKKQESRQLSQEVRFTIPDIQTNFILHVAIYLRSRESLQNVLKELIALYPFRLEY